MLVTGNLMRRISQSRTIAFEVLEQVREGAYASDTLRAKSGPLGNHSAQGALPVAAPLEPRDAALASQIVFGCLRFQKQLDYLIQRYSARKVEDLDPWVQIALRAAIFQLRYLDRIPAHAAVNDSVEFVKARSRAAAGLVNAVLRKVNRSPIEWPDAATELSVPEWLLARWTEHFGAAQAHEIARAALREPPRYIRIKPGDEMPAGNPTEPTEVAGAHRLLSPLETGVRLQDLGSQAIVPLLDLSPGHSYLDLCSAPGNKTLQALETPLGLAIACDISEKRIREVPPVCPRVVLDATRPLPFNIRFDRIFIDAPCSGTGTLARNPEIKWRLEESELGRFRDKQTAMLRRAVEALTPGGKLLYATCSLEREENEDVVERVLRESAGIVREREVWRLPGRDEGDGFYAAVLKKAASYYTSAHK